MGYVRNGIYTYKMGVEYHNFYANMHNYISVCVYIIIYIYIQFIYISQGFNYPVVFLSIPEHSGAIQAFHISELGLVSCFPFWNDNTVSKKNTIQIPSGKLT